MQQLQLFQIDAFTENVFHGNPAAVCPLEDWLDDASMQGGENFFVKIKENEFILGGMR